MAFNPVRSGLGSSFWKGPTESDRGGRGRQVQVLDLPWSHEDVSRLETSLLVATHEVRDIMVCGETLDLPDGQGRAPEAVWQVASPRGSHEEMHQITMDFITKLPWTAKGFDAIRLIVDWLTKSPHFLSIRESSSAKKLADEYMCEIVACHGVPVSIVCDRDVNFISRFW